MRSSSGKHYLALDQVRMAAAFMVFCWHFHPLPPTVRPAGGLALPLLSQGYTGVALFMTLSGYLFAKLLDGRAISYPAFLWNRFIRLAPLYVLVLAVASASLIHGGMTAWQVLAFYARGIVTGELPNGAWSIVVEAQFYVILPLLLRLMDRSPSLGLSLVVAGLAVRTAYWLIFGKVEFFAYLTLGGRIDQFTLGIVAFHFRQFASGKLALVAAIAVNAWFAFFSSLGGYEHLPRSLEWLWIIQPTIAGLCYSGIIAWFDNRPPLDGPIGRFAATAGSYSYSIYLLHFFVVWGMANWINVHIAPLSSFYVALPWMIVGYVLMVPVGFVSFRLIEKPFLRLRKRYTLPDPVAPLTRVAAVSNHQEQR